MFRYAFPQGVVRYEGWLKSRLGGDPSRLVISSATLFLAKWCTKGTKRKKEGRKEGRKEGKKERKKNITTIYTITRYTRTLYVHYRTHEFLSLFYLLCISRYINEQKKKKGKTTFLSTLVPQRSSSRIRSIGINFSSFRTETVHHLIHSLTYCRGREGREVHWRFATYQEQRRKSGDEIPRITTYVLNWYSSIRPSSLPPSPSLHHPLRVNQNFALPCWRV